MNLTPVSPGTLTLSAVSVLAGDKIVCSETLGCLETLACGETGLGIDPLDSPSSLTLAPVS